MVFEAAGLDVENVLVQSGRGEHILKISKKQIHFKAGEWEWK